MSNETNEVRVQLFDVEGKKYATCSSFAMAFLLDHCSVVEVIEDLIEEDVYKHNEIFIETSYELDGETFKAYHITQDGVMLLAEEFGRIVEQKREDIC